MLKRVVPVLAITLLLTTPCLAQFPEKIRVWTPQIAAGFSGSIGIVDQLFVGSFSLAGGVTYQPRRLKVVGAWTELDYSGYRVTRAELETLGVASGDLRVWALAGGLRLQKTGKVGVYGLLGLGWYRQEIDLVNPTQPVVGVACNPWWNVCGLVGVVATQDIVGSEKSSTLGYNAGFGLTFQLASGSEIYMEAKYHYIPTDVEPIEMLPFVLGYRWGS